MDDRIGPLQRNAFLLAYSYNIGLFKDVRLSVGSFMGFKQTQVNREHWENIGDETDALFLTDLSTGLQPEIQFGAVFYSKNYYVNVSAQNLIPSRLDFVENSALGRYRVHGFLSAGYKAYLDRDLTITPSAMLRYVGGAPVSVDLNGKLDYQDAYWLGLSFRSLEAFNVFAGLMIHRMVDVTYAFEWNINAISPYQSGTHELILGLRLAHPQTVLDPSSFWK